MSCWQHQHSHDIDAHHHQAATHKPQIPLHVFSSNVSQCYCRPTRVAMLQNELRHILEHFSMELSSILLKVLYPGRAVGGEYPMPQLAVAVQIQQLQDAVEIVAHATHAVAVNQLDAPRPHASLDMQSSFTTSDFDEYLVSKAGRLNGEGSLSTTGHTSSRMASSPGHSQEFVSG